MKTETKTQIILKATDLELKAILQNDIAQFKLKKQNLHINQTSPQKAA